MTSSSKNDNEQLLYHYEQLLRSSRRLHWWNVGWFCLTLVMFILIVVLGCWEALTGRL